MRKSLFTLFITCVAFISQAQNSIIISQPEYRILFKNYDNKIECMSKNRDSVYISPKKPNDAQITFVEGSDQSNDFFIVKPTVTGSLVLDFHNVIAGEDKVVESREYIIKVFPKPELQTTHLSKSTDNVIEVSYPGYFPIPKEILVLGGSVMLDDNTELSFIGNQIPPAYFSKLKSGSKVMVSITVREKESSHPSVLNSVLTVFE
jgi:hypothetical protein